MATIVALNTISLADDAKTKKPPLSAGEAAIAAMKIPQGFKVELWADEKHIANPVAFCIDEKGKLYIAETFRQGDDGGVVDNRGHMYWLDDDLAAQTIEDRRAFFLKHRKDRLAQWTKHEDRIRLLEDTDGDGRADKATVFSDGYKDLMDGTGAGLLAINGNVYYTCIPKLYRLRDTNNDGRADEKQVLSEGYGVRVAFRGHDLHGLTLGPDGRIYFSIGDRGYNITSKEGKVFKNPGAGAVFRCEQDGSQLEVIHTGLRNPQELVFDEYGNLFAGDNNSDSGDQARWVYIVEGGETGWNMAFQYLPDRGPWNREGWWHEWAPGKAQSHPAFLVPPIKHIGNGPSGVSFYPGTGFPEDVKDSTTGGHRGTFYMVDFKGGPSASGIWSFKLKPRGAWFEMTEQKQFVWNTLATDVDFGPDGAMYWTDWIEGWNGTGQGRVYRMSHPDAGKSEIVAQTKKLIAEGFDKRSEKELAELLKHADRRVRLGAQFALVNRNSYDILLAAIDQKDHPLARLHGVWGMGQIARRLGANERPAMLRRMAGHLSHTDPEIAAQIARVFGDVPQGSVCDVLLDALPQAPPRAQFFIAMALGRTAVGSQKPEAVKHLFEMLEQNKSGDPYLRHAAVMGLAFMGDADAVAARTNAASRDIRLGALLALRRLNDAKVSAFLNDADPALVTEAARAIHDVPIDAALPALADAIKQDKLPSDDALIRRVISANYFLGGQDRAAGVAAFAQREGVPSSSRIGAIEALQKWEGKSSRDLVLGVHRPVKPRPADEAKDAASVASLALLPSKAPAEVRQAAAKLAESYQIAAAGAALHAIVMNAKESGWLRAASLKAMGAIQHEKMLEATVASLAAPDANLRKEARNWLAKLKPTDAVAALESVLESGGVDEKQSAITTLASMKHNAADAVLEKLLDRFIGGALPAELQLELIEAATQRGTPRLKLKLAAAETATPKDDPFAGKRHMLAGGDAKLGEQVFWQNTRAQCSRCHKVGTRGSGEAGPNLVDVGKRQPRDHQLESILFPNRKIAQGFDTVDIETTEGDRIIGVLREDTAAGVTLVTPDNKRVVIAKKDIAERRKALSAMPEGIEKLLSPREIRDLVEYLAGLK